MGLTHLRCPSWMGICFSLLAIPAGGDESPCPAPPPYERLRYDEDYSYLRDTPRPYRYRTRGQMATLGRRHGIAVVGGLRVRGILGWLIARGYHMLQLPFHSRRARVMADWTSAAVFHRDVAELTVVGARRVDHQP